MTGLRANKNNGGARLRVGTPILIIGLCLALAAAVSACARPSKTGKKQSSAEKKAKPAQPGAANGESEKKAEPTAPEVKKTKLILYFSDDQAQKLVKETRDVTQTSRPAAAIVEALIAGPKGPGLPTMPEGTRLNNIKIVEGVAEVDLSNEYDANMVPASASVRMAVYSLVNSLAELSTIDRVRIKIDGENVDIIGGLLDVSEPLEPDRQLQ